MVDVEIDASRPPASARCCNPGEIVVLGGLPLDLYVAVLHALDYASADDLGGRTYTLRLECSIAQRLALALSTSSATRYEALPDLLPGD